ncbi:MAG: ATP-dependent sacrificial sulfur transferase LarE [Halobacteriota archaeon]
MPTPAGLKKTSRKACDFQDDKLERVRGYIRSHRSALIAFSGGVDSTVVAELAKEELGDSAVAVTVNNGALRHDELKHAAATAKAIGITHLSIALNALVVPKIKHNDPERCYYCKILTFSALRELANKLDLNVVMDGTNASDLNVFRPSLKALRELGIISPLIGLTKDEVRSFARMLDLPNANVPSNACLLTSFPYGTIVTKERIERVRQAERLLQASGVVRAKVRDHNGLARIEISKEDARAIILHSSAITETFIKLGFTYVTLDLEWLRSGSMDFAASSAKPNSCQL